MAKDRTADDVEKEIQALGREEDKIRAQRLKLNEEHSRLLTEERTGTPAGATAKVETLGAKAKGK